MLVKKKIYPRPHNNGLMLRLVPATTTKLSVNVPILRYDEGLGDPAAYNAHPEHTSFAEVDDTGCYPESRVNKIFTEIRMSASDQMWATDDISHITAYVIPWYVAFKEDLTAIDEKTSFEIQDLLALQFETTDRQTFPLYSGVKTDGDIKEIGATEPGLTTNTLMECIADYSLENLYDMLQYGTISKKLSSVIGKITRVNIKRDKTVTLRYTRANPKIKYLNEYAACGFIIHVPAAATIYQDRASSAITTATYVNTVIKSRYLEWNENFDHTKV